METMVTDMTPRLPEIGKIKIGGLGEERKSRAGNTFRMPEKYDYFKITKNIKNAKGDFIEDTEAMKLLGEKPKVIPIRLLFNDLSLCWQSRYVCYKGDTCIGRGDGTSWEGLVDGKWEAIEKPERQLDPGYTGKDKWKLSGVFTCILELASSTLGGVWRFRTTSFNSCNAIPSSLALIASQTGGHLQGIPLDMVVNIKQGKDPSGRTVKVPVVSILYRGTIEDLQNNARTLLSNVANVSNTKMLEAGERISLNNAHGSHFDEDSNVGAEYFSENKPKPAKPNLTKVEIEDAEEIEMGEEDYELLLNTKLSDDCGFTNRVIGAFLKGNILDIKDLCEDTKLFEDSVYNFLKSYLTKNKKTFTDMLGDDSKMLDKLPTTFTEIVVLFNQVLIKSKK